MTKTLTFLSVALFAGAAFTSAADTFAPASLRKTGAAPAAQSAAHAAFASMPEIDGVVVAASNWGANAKPGFYRLPVTDGEEFSLIVNEAYGSGVVKDNRLYTIARITMPELDIDYPRLSVYNLKTGEEIYFENYYSKDWSILPVDMDLDPVTGEVYAITYNSSMTGYQLSVLTFTDNSVTSRKVADMTGNWNAVAFDADGQLYGISKVNNSEGYCVSSTLNRIDKASGAVTPIGETGMQPEYMSSAAFDRSTGRLFWSVAPADNTGLLAEINIATGAAATVYNFPNNEEVLGLYVPAPAADADAPAAVTDLKTNFTGGSLSGTVSFTAPTTLFNGTPGVSALTYEIRANDQVVATGNTQYGAEVSADITVPAAAFYTIKASVSNTVGKGPDEYVELFIGNGIPQAPAPRATLNGGKVTLSWEPVTASTDGGYIDPAAVTYTVRRLPGAVEVASGLAATAYEDVLPATDNFTVYTYAVSAEHAGISSEAGMTRGVAVGEIVPPYLETFDSEDSLAGWTLINANGDSRFWMWSDLQNLRIGFSAQTPKDDWVVTPPVALKAGVTYTFSFDIYGDSADDTERVEVKMGDANTVAALTTALLAPADINSTKPVNLKMLVKPAVTGAYFIGIHAMSEPDKYMLNLDNVKIEEGDHTAILGIEADGAPQVTYRIDGTRVPADDALTPGLYIRNGRKIIVK